jgi:hypothetical protein
MVCLLIEVLPCLSGKGRVDVYIKKKGGVLWQCKELMLKELYADLTIRFMSRLCRKQLNPIIDLELLRKNKFIENLVVIAGKVAGEVKPARFSF